MNKHDLIEQVGGIEKAKAIVEGAPEGATHVGNSYTKLDGADIYAWIDREWWKQDLQLVTARWLASHEVKLDDLHTAIVQYEQLGDSEEFKVGDWIVSDDGCFPILSIQYGNLYEVGKGNFWELGSFKHATPAEIAAGHRLEAERHE